mmetsp:Transcript_11959/g.36057  ORF Transcript_11959/g.36057 Transcript_11959/m.36057 type:complete len:249 (+) Transcript_11959:584-1330(+)
MRAHQSSMVRPEICRNSQTRCQLHPRQLRTSVCWTLKLEQLPTTPHRPSQEQAPRPRVCQTLTIPKCNRKMHRPSLREVWQTRLIPPRLTARQPWLLLPPSSSAPPPHNRSKQRQGLSRVIFHWHQHCLGQQCHKVGHAVVQRLLPPYLKRRQAHRLLQPSSKIRRMDRLVLQAESTEQVSLKHLLRRERQYTPSTKEILLHGKVTMPFTRMKWLRRRVQRWRTLLNCFSRSFTMRGSKFSSNSKPNK